MKKIIFLLCIPMFFSFAGCSNSGKENTVDQLQTTIANNSASKESRPVTAAPTASPTITPRIIKNINTEDNELLSNLEELSKSPRKFDTEGEKRALSFLVDKMTEYGYQTQTQEFSVYHLGRDWIYPASRQAYFEQNREEAKKFGTGKNVLATAVNPEGKKTLYITAHYDTTEDTNGIRDNGSGVVVAMEIARQLQGISLPVNVEFIFFSAEEAGLQGSAYFVSRLTREEKEHAIGCINIDVVGQKGDYEVILKTYQGQINILSVIMDEFHEFRHSWSLASDHTSFFMGEIPAIYFADDKTILKDITENPLEEIDIDRLKELTKLICDFIINFNPSEYEEILQDGFIKTYTDLPKTKEIAGFSLVQINKVLEENAAGSDTQYILENADGNKAVITEMDSRFLEEKLAKEIQEFDSYNDHVKYKISQDKDRITVQYTDSWIGYNYDVLEGNLTKEEALEILNSQSEFTNGGALLWELEE
jgi:hypothetical protein